MFIYDIINNYILYDRKNVKYYEILNINDIDVPPKSIQITINAAINNSDIANTNENNDVFLDASGEEIESGDLIPSTDPFLEIKKKDINAYKNEYIYNKNTVDALNESNLGQKVQGLFADFICSSLPNIKNKMADASEKIKKAAIDTMGNKTLATG